MMVSQDELAVAVQAQPAGMVTVTVPRELAAPEVIEIQVTLEAAVQEQPAGMVTVTEPVEPAAANAGGAADSVALQTGAALWVML